MLLAAIGERNLPMASIPDGHAEDANRALGDGDDPASQLLPLVYEQLRAVAEQRLRGERSGHTLTPTRIRTRSWRSTGIFVAWRRNTRTPRRWCACASLPG
jgi:hypothetical protein